MGTSMPGAGAVHYIIFDYTGDPTVMTHQSTREWIHPLSRATIHARDTTGFYGLDRVRSNEDRLHSIETAELGGDLFVSCMIGIN
jgi:hypothetical protein